MSHFHNSRKPKKQSRTIRIPGNRKHGEGRDYGIWYRCWHCGYPCKVDRDSLGGKAEVAGISYQEYSNTEYSGKAILGNGALSHTFTASEKGADGTAKNVRYSIEPNVYAGCPYCGSRNWRGDYP